jgi:hypothetical protein
MAKRKIKKWIGSHNRRFQGTGGYCWLTIIMTLALE